MSLFLNNRPLSMNIARNKIDNDSSVSPWHPAWSIIYSCIDIYAYSCLKLLSNRPEAIFKQQNPSSNHEIRVLFEHSFYLKMHTAENAYCGPYFLSMTLLCFTSLLFSNICKKFCQRQCHASFGMKYITILHETKWPTFKTFFQVLVSFYVFL